MDSGIRSFLYWVDHQSKKIIEQSRTMSTKEKTIRAPKCARCRNHGLMNDLKGHKYLCRWRNCVCQNCIVVKDKQRITASRVAKLRKTRKMRISNQENIKHDFLNKRQQLANGQISSDQISTGSPSSISSVSPNESESFPYNKYHTSINSTPPVLHRVPVVVPNPCHDCFECRIIFDAKLKYLADYFPMCSFKTLGDALRKANGNIEDVLNMMN